MGKRLQWILSSNCTVHINLLVSWTIPQHAIVKVVLGVIRRLNVTISGSESTTASGAITGHCVTRDTWPRYPATSTRHSPPSLLQQTCLRCQLTVCCVCIFVFWESLYQFFHEEKFLNCNENTQTRGDVFQKRFKNSSNVAFPCPGRTRERKELFH